MFLKKTVVEVYWETHQRNPKMVFNLRIKFSLNDISYFIKTTPSFYFIRKVNYHPYFCKQPKKRKIKL